MNFFSCKMIYFVQLFCLQNNKLLISLFISYNKNNTNFMNLSLFTDKLKSHSIFFLNAFYMILYLNLWQRINFWHRNIIQMHMKVFIIYFCICVNKHKVYFPSHTQKQARLILPKKFWSTLFWSHKIIDRNFVDF